MTDSATPATAPDAPSPPAGRGRARFARERAFVGVVFFALTGAVIVNGAVQISRDTFAEPRSPSTFATCSSGLAALYSDFAGRLTGYRRTSDGPAQPYRPLRDPANRAALGSLDEQLRALRPVCSAEGGAAREAYNSLVLWRHQAQDLSGVEERVLAPDAERALRYRRSPPDPTPTHAPGTHP